jgi:hypothetical protein
VVVLGLVAGLLASATSLAQTAPATPPAVEATQPPSAKFLDEWRAEIARTHPPKKGCFKSSYPSTEWQEIPCTTPPQRPYPPASGTRPDTVGNGNDISAQVTGQIVSALGSFDKVTGATLETGTILGGSNCSQVLQPNVPNYFSLQLNTNTFTTSACNGAAGGASSCQGWQQFIYSNAGTAFIQYWLLGYGPTCPQGWAEYQNSCWKNSSGAVSVSAQTIAQLGKMSVTGQAHANGQDVLFLWPTNGEINSTSEDDNVLGLSQGWQVAEFNIVGDGCGSQANLFPGTTIVVRTRVSPGTDAPTAATTGFTGETNNLTLVGPGCPIAGESPAVVFTESNAAGATSMCACPESATWDPNSAQCICNAGDQEIVNGKCEARKNACGGTAFLTAAVGTACGTSCGRWSCNGSNALACKTFANACGGCVPVSRAPGEGPQPGGTCTCGGGAQGHYFCTGAKVLSCDCHS